MNKKKTQHKVHKEIKGFDIEINPFGELKSNMNIDDINAFLNKHLQDKRVEDGQPKSAPDSEEE
ncbi:MAG: hypothetical protein KA109_04180 [Saprospiraceae bacterium]|jgi:hypothetical protein|nr:hypothetical protein [Saprospiraceae bacterium]MBK6480488.1 hypothetical protein [Saprospiraceae bacterium]MBK6817141.1 hypothetical protein [Saprospiraceae bacterium]MBK7371691.1 hypothetical protein [Saprospiraceae bacterium]MBK7435832.1 hypothetical protein [Saprospiraceae bacterium]